MAVTTFTLPYVNTPPYFSGSAVSSLVPNVFPVAIDGRPYMVDQKSGRFGRTYEQRVRDSQDISTSPGEAAINPGGLWRRGQDSWHLGAGQQYADTADAKDFQFYKSKGIDVWTKGQVSLLNDTKVAYEQLDTSKNVRIIATQTAVFLTDNTTVKYSTNPFASSPTWTSVSGLPALQPRDIATDGTNIYLTYAGVTNSYGIWKINASYAASVHAYGHEFGEIGYAKGRLIAGAAYLPAVPYGDDIYYDPTGNVTNDSDEVKISPWEWIGFAGGQNAIYAAGNSGNKSVVFKITITSAGVLDKLVSALELPTGETVSSIFGYLGFILIGTNKGVRYCSTDAQANLIAGPIIPTSGPVYGFTAEDKYAWFTWSNYDGVSGGLGRLDLSTFVAPNQPAFATDIMYASTGDVLSVATFSNKRLFSIKGVGVVAEDTSALVASGEIESGIYRWGIPDRKFVAKVDTRATPLIGSISQYLNVDDAGWTQLDTWDNVGDTENSTNGTDTHAIEAAFKFKLDRSATVTSTGPTMTRWMARAYVAPYRSQQFVIPILLHNTIRVRDKEYFYDVEEHQNFFDSLIESPRIIVLQIGTFTHSVIVDDVEWGPSDAHGNYWSFEGTLIVTLRSVEN
jgi:hypothetical protein